eukprot:3797360-Rhodomonas_salina.1
MFHDGHEIWPCRQPCPPSEGGHSVLVLREPQRRSDRLGQVVPGPPLTELGFLGTPYGLFVSLKRHPVARDH